MQKIKKTNLMINKLKSRLLLGDKKACYELAMVYISFMPDSKSQEIFKLLKIASNFGLIDATYYLGIAYLEEWAPQKSIKLSLKYTKLAAEKGLAEACNRLAVKYEGGVEAPKNLRLAIKWYLKGAKLGDPIAQYNLAVNYEKGIGVKKNIKKALNWYEASMLQGFDEAKADIVRLKKLIKKTK